jgi:DNA-binding response OmpR family regulator
MAILLVEDEQHILGLDELEDNWEVETAVACDLAIARLRNAKYDLIIVDLILPITMGETRLLDFEPNYQNGLEERYGGLWLIRHIREHLQIQTPIIVLTIVVGSDREPVEQLLNGKIAEYVSKYDVMPQELCEKIRNLLLRVAR